MSKCIENEHIFKCIQGLPGVWFFHTIYLFIYLFIYWQYLTRLAKLSYNLVQIGHWKVLLNFSRISDVKMPKNYVVFLVEHFWIYFIGYNI